MLEYAQSFGSIVKESLKRTMKWAADYFTSAKSHYLIPDVGAQFKDLPVMAPLPVGHCQPEDVVTMKNWVAPFRPVRQRTVRQEMTKDKAGTLPIAFYLNEERTNVVAEEIILDDVDENVHENEANESDASSQNDDSDDDAPSDSPDESDEYDTDTGESDDEPDTNQDQDQVKKPTTMSTRPGRIIKVVMRMDL